MTNLKKNKLLAVVLLFVVIFQSGHAFQTIYPALMYIPYIPAVIALVIILIDRECHSLSNPQNLALWLFMFMVLATAIVNVESGTNYSYIQITTLILAAYCIVKLYSFKQMAECYLVVMTVVSVVALIGYVFLNNTSYLDFLPKVESINDMEYGVGVIYNYLTMVPDRNCGMFWEPGLFATHLTIAMMLELITKQRASALRIILFSICIFTANSSAGFVLWFLCLILLFIRKRNTIIGPIKNIFSVILLIIAIGVVINFDTILSETSLGENEYFQKLYSESILDSTRSNAIGHNLELFATAPIFGVGYVTAMSNIAYVADTSTTTFLMSVFGILGSAYTVFIIYGVFKIKKLNLLSKILVLAIILIIINKEPHHQILFTWVLIFYLANGLSADVNSDKVNDNTVRGRNEIKKLF
ncbi:MAG: hypothetical protein IJX74_02450 [Clostridia bacterium]|nr:hypothetical protein [Clostridia bacterium]